MEAENEIGGTGAANEIAVGILSGRQLDQRDGQTSLLEPPGESLGGALARLVFILVEDQINPATRRVGKLTELGSRQVRAEGAGGVAKARLPEYRQVEQAFDQDHGEELANRFPGEQAALGAGRKR